MALAVLLPVHVAAEGGHEAAVQRRVAAAEGARQQTLRQLDRISNGNNVLICRRLPGQISTLVLAQPS